MLVLSRKCGEKVVIGNGIIVTVLAAKGNQVKLAFAAPPQIQIARSELVAKLQATQADETFDSELATKPA
jgi:carbon storage regulator